MVSVNEADNVIGASLLGLGTEAIPLAGAMGRVLKQAVVADRDFPPFNRVMMDGIAIQFAAWEKGVREFVVEGLSAAGTPQKTLTGSDGCLEVMTGAVMPANADTVVKYEEVTLNGGKAVIRAGHQVKPGQHVHLQGADRQLGAVLLAADRVLGPAEIAVLATVGRVEVTVARSPRVAVIATGDELVEIEAMPLPHQIRKSNVHALVAALQAHKFVAKAFHLLDDKAQIRQGLKEILANYDAVVLSGGVSKGKLDFVPEILAELGVEKLFHFVAQRPGKPFWFGRYKKAVVFALPGNPVSSFVGLTRYVVPFLYRSAGVEPKAPKAVLAEDFTFKPNLTYFLQVKLHFDDHGRLLATPAPGQGSGDLANLPEADAFLELPQGKDTFKAGEVFPCWGYR